MNDNEAKKTTIATLFFGVTLVFVGLGIYEIVQTKGAFPFGCEYDRHFIRGMWASCGDWAVPRSHWGPIVPWLIAFLTPIFGKAFIAGKALSLLCGSLLVGTTYLAGRRILRSEFAAVFAALVVAINPVFLFYGTTACTDMPAALFVVLTVVLYLRTFEKGDMRFAALAGLCAAVAMLMRDQAVFVVAAIAVSAIAFHPSRLSKRIPLVAIFVSCAAIPVVLITLEQGGGLEHLRSRSSDFLSSGAAVLLEQYLLSAKRLLWTLGFFPLIGFTFISIVGLRSERWREIFTVLIACALYFFGVGWFGDPEQNDLRRLYIPLVPAATIFLAVGLAKLGNNRKIMFAAASMLLILFAVKLQMTLPRGRPATNVEIPAPIPSVFRPDKWLYLRDDVVYSESDQRAAAAAAELVRREKPGCEQVLTPSVIAATQLPNAYILDDPVVSNDAVANALQKIVDRFGDPAQFVLVDNEPDHDLLVPGSPFGPENRFTLEKLFSFQRHSVYRIHLHPGSHVDD
jgi:4-amino-4-deoxy-L-arabinose transferase-like glycosyltransferase